jgi:hypothetical protein
MQSGYKKSMNKEQKSNLLLLYLIMFMIGTMVADSDKEMLSIQVIVTLVFSGIRNILEKDLRNR